MTSHLEAFRLIHRLLTTHRSVDPELNLNVLVGFQGIKLLELLFEGCLHHGCLASTPGFSIRLSLGHPTIADHAYKGHVVAYPIDDLHGRFFTLPMPNDYVSLLVVWSSRMLHRI